MADKRYYWIKLKDTFFTSDTVDFLMSQKDGANYVVLYQMLCLKSANTGGELSRKIGEIIIPYDVEKIQRDCKYFSVDTVRIALTLYKQLGLIYEQENGVLQIANFDNLVGSEGGSAERMRRLRSNEEPSEQVKSTTPRTNAQRQRAFRAKQSCKEIQHVPYVEDYANNKRYGGNYYIVMKRDKYRCAICGSIENLCVHHIDGYDPNKPENNQENKMVVLCRCCHSRVHAGTPLPESLLQSIDYHDDTVTKVTNVCDVTSDGRERDKIIDSNIDTSYYSPQTPQGEKEEEKPTKAEVITYFTETLHRTESEAVSFWAWNENNGWRVGKKPMKVWQPFADIWRGSETTATSALQRTYSKDDLAEWQKDLRNFDDIEI